MVLWWAVVLILFISVLRCIILPKCKRPNLWIHTIILQVAMVSLLMRSVTDGYVPVAKEMRGQQ